MSAFSRFRMRGSKAAVFLSVSALALVTSEAAMAQQTSAAGVEEIIVTVQRRSEKMQDVPVAMTAVSGAKLESSGITNLHDMVKVTSGVIFSGGGNMTNPSVRGVFSSQTDPGNDGNTAIYVDGIYQPNQIANNMDLPDVSRVEVLKGPQGTLFGRNAAGGAIRIFTRDPSMTDYHGFLDVSYARFNDVNVKGFFGGPLIEDKLAMSISGNYQKSDGYYFDPVNNRGNGGNTNRAVRTKLIFTPTDNLKIQFTGAYTYHRDNNIQSYNVLNGSTSARLFDPNVVVIDQTRPYLFTSTYPPDEKSNGINGGLKITLDTDIGEFSSITGMNHIRGYYNSDNDVTAYQLGNVPAYQIADDKSQEFNFSSKKFGQFQGSAGVFYYSNDGRYDPILLSGPIYGGNLYGWMQQITTAYAAFGELNWTPIDTLTIIGGVRYSHEKREANGIYSYTLLSRPSSLPALGPGVLKNGNVSPRASIKYRVTDEGDNVYFTFSQGFKSGGFNLSGLQPTPYKPEKVTAYEVGIKTAPERMISANLAAFYYDYANQQVSANTGTTNITLNAATSEIKGIDGDIIFRATNELSFTSGISILRSKFKSFPGAAIITPQLPANCLCGYVNTVGDLSGQVLPYSPRFTMSLGADWVKDFSFGTFNLSAHMFHSAGYNYDNQGLAPQGEYTTLNLRASFQPAGTNFSVYVFGRNVTDERYYDNAFANANAIGVRYAPPAVWGGGLKYEF
jgi:iron complex outermembrane receptor protein